MNARRSIGLGAALTACIGLAACKEKEAAPEPIRPVLSMVVRPIMTGDDAVVGTVEPRIKTEFSFRVLGRLITRTVYVGDTVEKGQTFAAIDPAALELAVRIATSEVSNGQAQQANAAGAESRQRTLLGVDATSKAAFETIEQTRASADASLIRAQANLAKAKEQLSYAQLQADFRGVVTAVGAEVGQVVSPGQMVVTIARPDIREAVIDVADDAANNLKIGTPFTVALQLDQAIKAEGKVREIAPQADAATRTRRVRITLDHPPETFRLGTTIIAADAGGRNQALLLPASAILNKDGKTSIWLIDPDSKTVKTRPVETAPDENGRVRVTSGLEAGQRVVTAGVNSLSEGQTIRLDQEPAL
ncbi:MAG: putative component of multidrug efflux system family [Tardiphaga sp.]|nr:putative component of multidrug efflux system family [Tardiphaga sp.]